MRKEYVLLIALLPLLGGCLLPFESLMGKADMEIPAEFQGSVPEQGITLEQGGDKWWLAWDDKGLNSLMDEVMQENYDISRAVARYQQFNALSVVAGAARKPYLSVGSNAARAQTPGVVSDTTGGSYKFSATAGYEVDLWGKLSSRETAARFNELASKEDLKSVYISVTAQTVDLYFFAVEQQAQLELTERLIASFKDALDMVTLRYESGLSPALDVYLAKQNLLGGMAKKPVFEANLAVTNHALSVIAGRFPGNDLAPSKGSLEPQRNPTPEVVPSLLLRQRPDIEAVHYRLQARDSEVAAAIADRFPSINLTGNIGRSSVDTAFGLVTGSFWSLIADIALPVIDGDRRKAEVLRSEAVFREELASYQQKVLVAFREVEDALSQIKSSSERIKLLADRMEAAEGSFRVARERYVAGLDDYLTVLSSQVIRFDVESQLIAAKRQLLTERISLLRAMGGSWMVGQADEKINMSTK